MNKLAFLFIGLTFGLLLSVKTNAAELYLSKNTKIPDGFGISWWIQGDDSSAAESVKLLINNQNTLVSDLILAPNSNSPICYLLMIDTSLSMNGLLPNLIRPLLNDLILNKPAWHQFAITGFDTALTDYQALSDDNALLAAAVAKLQIKGQRTELFRSALEGLKYLQECNLGRRILVVISDGDAEDLPGAYALDDVVDVARQNNINIFTLGVKDTIQQQYLRRMAEDTHGWYRNLKSNDFKSSDFFNLTDTCGTLTIKHSVLPSHIENAELEVTLRNKSIHKTSFQIDSNLNVNDISSEWQTLWALIPISFLLMYGLFVYKRKHGILLSEVHKKSISINPETSNIPIEIPYAAIRYGDRVFKIVKPSTRIGAVADNDFIIDEPTVGRYQAIIDFKDGAFYLTDRGATNPSVVNGGAVKHTRLENDDLLEFGEWQGIFEVVSCASKEV